MGKDNRDYFPSILPFINDGTTNSYVVRKVGESYVCKELNPENNNFFEFNNKPVIEGTAIECSNSGFRMPEDKQLT